MYMAMMGKKRGAKNGLEEGNGPDCALAITPSQELKGGIDRHVPSSFMIHDLLMRIRSQANTGLPLKC